MSARIKAVAAIYVFILAGIVILANGRGTNYFSFVAAVPFGDKIGHFCLMGMLSFVVNVAFGARTVRFWRFDYLLGNAIVAAVVFIEECSQLFVRGRSFDAVDLVADAAGIVLFGEAARLLVRKRSSARLSRG